MKILHRFMLKQFIGPFVMIFTIAIFVLLLQFLWKYIDDLVGKGLDFSVIGELLLYTCAQLAIMAFPLAVLIASIFTLGNMGENYELIALKAAGISLQRIVFPLILLSVVIAFSSFVFANNVTPVANLKMRTLIHDIQQQRPELQIREGIFYNGIEGYSIRIGNRNYENNQLYNLRIYNHTERTGNSSVILADSGFMAVTADKRFLEVTLYHGRQYIDMNKKEENFRNRTYPFRRDFFEEQTFRMLLPEFGLERSDEQIFKQSYQMMNIKQLSYTIDSIGKIISDKESELKRMLQPVYIVPEKVLADTAHRKSVVENYREVFDQKDKLTRQTIIQDAVNNVRSQKEQFAGAIYELNDKNSRISRYGIEWHKKITMSLACLILFFVGAPLGAIVRKGGLGTPIIIAILFFVLYYVISIIGEKSARGGNMTPFAGTWLSTFIVMPLGVFLTYKATRDSAIFNQELYLSYIKKGLRYIFAISLSPRPGISISATEADLQPENLVSALENLSKQCIVYLNTHLNQKLRFRKIWYREADSELGDIAKEYDRVKALLNMSHIEVIKETLEEYPSVTLQYYKIKRTSIWQPILTAIVFPVWIYLYLKALTHKYILRNELRNMISTNQNLINELNSMI